MTDGNIDNWLDQLSDLGHTLMSVVGRATSAESIDAIAEDAELDDGPLQWGQLETRELTRVIVEAVLEAQRDRQVQADRYERSDGRQDQRNGFYRRKRLPTPYGMVTDVKIPCLREGSLELDWLGKSLTEIPQIRDLSVDLFNRGMSVRAIAKVSEALFGEALSKSTISRFNEVLEERYREWLDSEIEESLRYLKIDGLELKVSRGGQACSETAIVAMGITEAGERRIVGFTWGASEDAETAKALLRQLEDRGLAPEQLELVTIDGGKGLHAALSDRWPDVAVQRCWAHKSRNIIGCVRQKNRGEIADDLKQLQTAASQRQAERRIEQFVDKWEEREPQAVRSLEEAVEHLHTYLEVGVPSEHWQIVRTTNYLERAFQEFQRKFKEIPMMPTAESAERLVYGQIEIINQRWRGRQIDTWDDSSQ